MRRKVGILGVGQQQCHENSVSKIRREVRTLSRHTTTNTSCEVLISFFCSGIYWLFVSEVSAGAVPAS